LFSGANSIRNSNTIVPEDLCCLSQSVGANTCAGPSSVPSQPDSQPLLAH